jgi:hypothetical protein
MLGANLLLKTDLCFVFFGLPLSIKPCSSCRLAGLILTLTVTGPWFCKTKEDLIDLGMNKNRTTGQEPVLRSLQLRLELVKIVSYGISSQTTRHTKTRIKGYLHETAFFDVRQIVSYDKLCRTLIPMPCCTTKLEPFLILPDDIGRHQCCQMDI